MSSPIRRDELPDGQLKLKIIVTYKNMAPPGASVPDFHIRQNFFPAPGENNWWIEPEPPLESQYLEVLQKAVAVVQEKYNLPSHRLGSTARSIH
ncbi:hypothetical protein [Dyella sp.]|uniref:hypothetical protein n=1 Tax=Dyella sp. TaxID=1869338 RepID=UPI002FD92F84